MAKNNATNNDLDDLLGESTDGNESTATAVAEEPKPTKGKGRGKSKAKANESDSGTTAADVTIAAGYEVIDMPVSDLYIDASNPRQDEPDEDDVKEMVKRIRATGSKLLSPIHVTEDGGILAGRRRWAAYKAMKKATIPAIVFKGEAAKYNASVLALVEQDSHKALTPLQMAQAIQRGIEAGEFADQSDAAKKIGVSASTVNRLMQLITDGTPELLEALNSNQISPTAAVKIAGLNESDQKAALETAAALGEGRATVKAIDKIVKQHTPKDGDGESSNGTGRKGGGGGRGRKKTKEQVDQGNLPQDTWVQITKLDPETEDGDNYQVLVTFGFRTPANTFTKRSKFDIEAELKACVDRLMDECEKIGQGMETARKELDG